MRAEQKKNSIRQRPGRGAASRTEKAAKIVKAVKAVKKDAERERRLSKKKRGLMLQLAQSLEKLNHN